MTKDNLVFVYGTLMRGHYNHSLLLDNSAVYVDDYTVVDGYKMHSLGAFPAVVPEEEESTPVFGELFYVNDVGLQQLDMLEGYPNFYNRVQVNTLYGPAWMYVMENDDVDLGVEVTSGSWSEHVDKCM